MNRVLSLLLAALAGPALLACSFGAGESSQGSGGVGGVPEDGGAAGGLGAGAAIDWINFVRFGGITYLANSHSIDQRNQALSRDILGRKFDEVRFMVAGAVSDPNYQIKDGDAAFWEKGTAVYEVKGYDPRTLLAAEGSDGRIILFEADSNPAARKGRDLLDIEGKVRGVRLLSNQDGTSEVGRLSEPDGRQFVAYVLDAPVDQRATGMSEMAFIIEFTLADGIVIERAYLGGTGELSRGVFLPLNQVRPLLGPLAGQP